MNGALVRNTEASNSTVTRQAQGGETMIVYKAGELRENTWGLYRQRKAKYGRGCISRKDASAIPIRKETHQHNGKDMLWF